MLEDYRAGFGDWVHYNTADEVKKGTRPNAKLGAGSRHYFDVIQRGQFTQFLSAVAGIDGLLPDRTLFGGGLHEIASGGKFSVHIDFNKHPVTQLDNRLVFITYLNKGWQPAWGGRAGAMGRADQADGGSRGPRVRTLHPVRRIPASACTAIRTPLWRPKAASGARLRRIITAMAATTRQGTPSRPPSS